MFILTGLVTDTEKKQFTGNDGQEITTFNIFVASGRETFRTTGPDKDAKRGEVVALLVQPKSYAKTDEVSLKRIAKLSNEALMKIEDLAEPFLPDQDDEEED